MAEQTNAKPQHSEPLTHAIDAARLLLEFAVESRHRVPEKIDPKLLLESIEAIEVELAAPRRPSAQLVAAFWTQYDRLAVEMYPVSARSIVATRAVNAATWRESWQGPAPWLALISAVLFMLAAYLQGFWVNGTDLLAQIEKAEPPRQQAIDKLTQPRLDRARADDKLKVQQRRREALDKAVDAALAAESAASAASTAGAAPPRGAAPRKPTEAQTAARNEVVTAQTERKRQSPAIDERIESIQLEISEAESRYAGAAIEVKGHDEVMRSYAEALARWCKMCDREWLSAAEARRDDLRRQLDALQAQRAALRQQLSAAKQSRSCAPQHPQEGSGAECVIATQIDALRTPEKNLEGALHDAEVAQSRSMVQRAHALCDNLGGYVIPLLMGMLGALVYLLRDIVEDIDNYSYTSRSVATAVVAVSLGAAAGLLGRLLLPSSGSASLATFSPFVLAFIFGYGVRALFALLDKIVSSFTPSTSGSTASTTALRSP